MLGKLIGKLVPGHRGRNLLSSAGERRTALVVISYCPALTLIGVKKGFSSLLYSLEIIRLHRGRKLWKFIYLLYKQDVVSVRMQNSA